MPALSGCKCSAKVDPLMASTSMGRKGMIQLADSCSSFRVCTVNMANGTTTKHSTDSASCTGTRGV